MRKYLFLSLAMLFLFSCKKEVETYSDLIKQEKVILDQFVKLKGFKILSEFPKDSIFAENEFLLLENGVYLNISNYGDRTHPSIGDTIQTTAKGFFMYKGELTESFDGFNSSSDETKWPLEFKYGVDKFVASDYLSVGYCSALEYVGSNSTVSMIVPFEVGSSLQNTKPQSIYFEKVTFVFK